MKSANILSLNNLNPIIAKLFEKQGGVGPKAKMSACHVEDKGSSPLHRSKDKKEECSTQEET